MRRIRNWLRSAKSQDRFSDLSILHIENDLTANLSGVYQIGKEADSSTLGNLIYTFLSHSLYSQPVVVVNVF